MARKKLDKTLADYMAIAATPVLIMLLVGSLVFFLQELFYRGGYNSRVSWILFWFVIGAVLIARIAMEQGRAYAGMFTLALGGAVALAIFRFSDGAPWIPILSLGVIWWCADKLTWDCTLIDESEDASGEGLLQIAGVADEARLPGSDNSGSEATPATEQRSADSSTDDSDADDGPQVRKRSPADDAPAPLWKRLFLNTSERAGKPHAPGLWVVYFSLAALPIFGFGQTMIPTTAVASRDAAFRYLLVYVGAALGLLLLTSFLGLRRYLRQRNLQMPPTMAATWVGMGSAITALILLTALLLPRPQGDYSIVDLIDTAADELQEASDQAFVDLDDGGRDEGQPFGEADGDVGNNEQNEQKQGAGNGQQQGDPRQNGEQQQAEQQQPGDQQPGDQQQGGGQQDHQQGGQQQGNQQQAQPQQQNEQQQNGQQQGEQQQGGQQQPGGQQQNGQQQGEQQQNGEQPEEADTDAEQNAAESSSPPPETPEPSSFLSNLSEMVGDLFRWLIYGLLSAAGLYLLIRHWSVVSEFFARLWAELQSLFGRRPGPDSASDSLGEEEPAAPPPRPFSDYENPFASGSADRRSSAELVRYTFEALQAWAVEHDAPRSSGQTPLEFSRQLRGRRFQCGDDACELAQIYSDMAYGGQAPPRDCQTLLKRLWQNLRTE